MDHPAADPALSEPVFWVVFLGGIAAGAYAFGCLAVVFGDESDRRATRVSAYLAFPLLVACAALLAAAPQRGPRPVASALAVAGVFSLGSFLKVLAEDGWFGDWPGLKVAETARTAFALAGAASALGFGAATGLLLPTDWTGKAWLAAVLLASACPLGVSAVLLLNRWRLPDLSDEVLARLGRANGLAIVVELAVLAAQALSVRGPSGLAFMCWPGMLIPLFVVPVGLVVPLILGEARGARGEVDAAVLVLLGGFVLRVAMVGIPTSLLIR